jgi:hypothetical protein
MNFIQTDLIEEWEEVEPVHEPNPTTDVPPALPKGPREIQEGRPGIDHDCGRTGIQARCG